MTYQFIPGAADDIALIPDHAALRHYAQDADPRAFEVLTRRYQAMVLATCRRVLGNSTDADDAVQETFLKLARSAGDVRSNVAAWLHACAFRVSIDLLRSQASRRRAEANAATAAPADETLATWRELEPLIDEALGKLHESDRELIVSRFLVGRSQAEMAAEAGVNPGTIHRRLDAALERLRTHLRAGGCVLGAAAFVTALNHAPAAAQAAPALSAALGKVGLSQVAMAGAAPKVAGVGAAGAGGWIAATIAGVVLTGGASALLISPPPATPTTTQTAAAAPEKPASVLAEKGSSFAKPTKEIKGYSLIENYSESPVMTRLYFDGSTVYIGPDAAAKKAKNGLVLKITSITPDAKPARVSFVGAPVGAADDVTEHSREMIGHTIDATYAVDGRRLAMTGKFDDREGDQVHRAIRPAPGSTSDKAGNATGNDPLLAGAWVIVDDRIVLKMSDSEIVFADRQSDSPAERYRIIEWTEADGYAKVQTICTAYGPTRGAVGKRFKLLIRKDDKGKSKEETYTMLAFDADSDKRDTWPEKFEYVPGKQLRAFVFRKD